MNSLEKIAAAVADEKSNPWPANYPEPSIYRMRMQSYLNHTALLLVREAEALGFVLTITQHSAGPTPAIGHTSTEISVTPKRIQAS